MSTLIQLQKFSKLLIINTCEKYKVLVSEKDSKEILLKKLIGIPLENKLKVNKLILKNRCKELNKKHSGNVSELIYNLMNMNIQNKGTGAGGSNTNKTGLSYEKLTNLSEEINIIKSCKTYNIIKFQEHDIEFIQLNKRNLFNYMVSKNKINKDITNAHGCKQPDECYVREDIKNIIIIEKKFQQCNGSVCEKIQTSEFKKWQYSRLFPEYKIEYIYCLSDWFKKNCVAELEYLQFKKNPVFWGNDINYKIKIIDYIINYK